MHAKHCYFFFLSKLYRQCVSWTHDPGIKGPTFYQLSQPGVPIIVTTKLPYCYCFPNIPLDFFSPHLTCHFYLNFQVLLLRLLEHHSMINKLSYHPPTHPWIFMAFPWEWSFPCRSFKWKWFIPIHAYTTQSGGEVGILFQPHNNFQIILPSPSGEKPQFFL